jgi:hypothetical protein
MIDLTIHQETLDKNIRYCREKSITLPTLAMMKDPELIPDKIKEQLKRIGLWDVHPANLYRITWKNEQKDAGGLFHGANHFVLPPGTYWMQGQHNHDVWALVPYGFPQQGRCDLCVYCTETCNWAV